MLAPFKIYPPENHQDFEYLCLKLWGDIWNIPDDIDLNSTNSQGQDGVDILGIPLNEKKYFGIQCKNKGLHYLKNGKKNILEKKIIEEEVERAKSFKPPLKKLIIVTSHDKDKALQEFVRELNISHINQGLFEIQICFWDYISRQVQERKQVYDWYVKNEGYSNGGSKVEVTFENNKKEIEYFPEFTRTKVIYRLEREEEKRESNIRALDFANHFNEYLINENWFLRKLNKIFKLTNVDEKLSANSSNIKYEKLEIIIKDKHGNPTPKFPKEKIDWDKPLEIIFFKNLTPSKEPFHFKIKINNIGDKVIEDYQLHFSLEGDFSGLDVNIGGLKTELLKNFRNDTFIKDNLGTILPNTTFLVQKDIFISKDIYFYPDKYEDKSITINWKLLARDYNDEGYLTIRTFPKYIEKQKIMFVEKESDSKIEYEIKEKMIEYIPMLNY